MPKTTTYKLAKSKQAKDSPGVAGTNGVATGQSTLDSHVEGTSTEQQATNGASGHEAEAMDVDPDEDDRSIHPTHNEAPPATVALKAEAMEES